MGPLPDDFAETLAQVLVPAQRRAAAGIIEAATSLDDEGLRIFLELFAARVRSSAAPVSHEELEKFLASARGRASAP
jgi:hypothetical protein